MSVWETAREASRLLDLRRTQAALALLRATRAHRTGWGLLLRSRARAQQGHSRLAEADATRAFDLDADCGAVFGLPSSSGRAPGAAAQRALSSARIGYLADPAVYAARAFAGKLAVMAGRSREGLRELDRAVRLAPRRAHVFAWRAETRRRLGDLSGAAKDARRAVALDPRHAVAWVTLAATLRQTGRPERALAAALKASRLSRGYEAAPLEAARACAALGRWKSALTHLESAARRAARLGWRNLSEGGVPASEPAALTGESEFSSTPARGRLLAWAGEFELSRGRARDALEFLDRAQREAPSFSWIPAWRGEARLVLGDAAGAEKDLARACARSPRYARAWNSLARARFERGRPRAALRASQRALALEPDWAWALFWRGACEAALGSVREACADFERCLVLDPGFVAARRALVAVRSGSVGISHVPGAARREA